MTAMAIAEYPRLSVFEFEMPPLVPGGKLQKGFVMVGGTPAQYETRKNFLRRRWIEAGFRLAPCFHAEVGQIDF